MSKDGVEWEFQQGETLVKEEDSQPQMPGVGRLTDDDPTEYTVKRRLIDPDDGKRLYYLEWEEDAPKGSISDKNTKNMLYSASVVRMHYRSVDTEGGAMSSDHLPTCPECGYKWPVFGRVRGTVWCANCKYERPAP